MPTTRSRMFLVLAMLCLAGSAVSQAPLPPVFRLPTSITPVKYLLQLEPDMVAKTVSGVIMIEMLTNNQSDPMNSITLHLGVDVTVKETMVTLLAASGVMVPIGAIEYDDANTLIKIVLPDGKNLLQNEMYVIAFQFASLLYSEPNGLFIGSYNDTSNYVASYFRPTFARNVFPCFDEPQFKTPITLRVLRPANYCAVCTAPLINSTQPDVNDMVLDTFETSEAISLHSLGLFISPVTPVIAMGMHLYVPPGTPTNVSYLETLLQNLNNTFGSLPTLGGTAFNLVVLPDKIFTSFSSYGIIYSSPEVYMDQEPGQGKQFFLRLKFTLAFLQQYLEYQMTPVWWSDIWLSESVGTFVAMMLQPEYTQPKLIPWIKVEMRKNGFGPDFSDSSRPVVDDQLLSRWDIENEIISGSIKYKGLNVLTMWNNVMPEGLVMKTILDYVQLKKSVVTTVDFMGKMVDNIRANTTYDVTPAIDQLQFWLNTTGNPVLTYWPLNNSMFTLTQSTSCSEMNNGSEPVWPISVSYIQNSSRDWTFYRQDLWLLSTSLNITYLLDKWIVFNLETAPYRVNYGQWDQIITALKTDLVASSNTPDTIRAMVQEDATALALAGCLPFPTLLSVLNNTERNQADWIPIAKIFDAITAKIGDNHNVLEAFELYAASLFPEELLNSFDLRNSSANLNVEFVRAVVTPWLCEFDLGTCRQAATELFQQLLEGNTTGIDTEDIDNVACQGARYNTSVLSQVMTAYQNTHNPWMRYLCTLGLSCIRDPSSVQTILNTMITSNSPFSAGDARTIMVGLAGSVQNSAEIVNYIVAQSTVIQKMLGVGALANTIQALGKFNVDLSNLWSLTNVTLGLDPYVVQMALWSMKAANDSSIWWQNYGAALKSALPAVVIPTTTAQTTTNQTTAAQTTAAQTTAAQTTAAQTTAAQTTTAQTTTNQTTTNQTTTNQTTTAQTTTAQTTTDQTTTAQTTTPPPSSAKSLMDFHIVALVVTTTLTVITVNFS